MKYRQIETNFWEDNYIITLTNLERLFFLYLFTNPKVNMCGIYELPDKIICYTLDLTLSDLGLLKAKLEKDNKFYFYRGWVFIINFSKHNMYSPAKPVVASFVKDYNNIPSYIKQYFLIDLYLPYEFPIKDADKVIVKYKDKVKDKRVAPTLEPTLVNEAKVINSSPFE